MEMGFKTKVLTNGVLIAIVLSILYAFALFIAYISDVANTIP